MIFFSMASSFPSGSFNTVYRKVGDGKWDNVRDNDAVGYGSNVGSATRAAARKSHANRQAQQSVVVDDGYGRSGGGGVKDGRMDRVGLKGKRGWAKKGGGGHGKFTWGKPGDEVYGLEASFDKEDPNYDSFDDGEAEKNVIFDVGDYHAQMAAKAGISLNGLQGGGHLFGAPPGPGSSNPTMQKYSSLERLPAKIPLKEFKEKCVEATGAFLLSEDVSELKDDLVALHSPMLHYEFVRRSITLSMERHARERELVSIALSELYGSRTISAEQFAKGFERLFEIMDDLVLDIPSAKTYLSQFLARAVADEILPPSFVSDPLMERLGGEVIDQAKVLLSIKHGLVRLDHIWGTTSHASVTELKEETRMILKEFLNSSDLDEACRCIKRLNVPYFHHEVVKRAVVLSLDCREREQAMMSSLLAELSSREIISEKQMEMGFARLYESLADLELDTPGCAQVLRVFLSQAVQDRCLSDEAAERIRKISERS